MFKFFPYLNVVNLNKKKLVIIITLIVIIIISYSLTRFNWKGLLKKEDDYLQHIANKSPEIEKKIYLEAANSNIILDLVEVFAGNIIIDLTAKENKLESFSSDVVALFYLVSDIYQDLKQVTIRVAGQKENSKEKTKVICVVFADYEDIAKIKLESKFPQNVDIIKSFETWLDSSLFK